MTAGTGLAMSGSALGQFGLGGGADFWTTGAGLDADTDGACAVDVALGRWVTVAAGTAFGVEGCCAAAMGWCTGSGFRWATTGAGGGNGGEGSRGTARGLVGGVGRSEAACPAKAVGHFCSEAEGVVTGVGGNATLVNGAGWTGFACSTGFSATLAGVGRLSGSLTATGGLKAGTDGAWAVADGRGIVKRESPGSSRSATGTLGGRGAG
jgi:hypothetical protein